MERFHASRWFTDIGHDAIGAEEAPETKTPFRVGHSRGAGVPLEMNQLLKDLMSVLRREIAPQQATAANALLAVREAIPPDTDDGRMRETK